MLLITREILPEVLARAQAEHEVRALNMVGPFDAAKLLAACDGVDAILCNTADKFTAGIINALPPSVKVIATYSVGTEHLDLAAAAARGIKIANTPGVLDRATAEMSLLLLLMAARRAGEGERLLRAGKWRGIAPTFLLGHDVAGKTLGIYGMGRIGQVLARFARGLDMTIHYHNRTRLPPGLEQGAIYHERAETFLPALDFLSINAPGNPSTTGWLNAARLAQLKPGAIVINTGRGPIVDDEALIAALKSGHVRAAGLDVYNNEPDIHPGYYALENAVLIPHLGSATIETRTAMGHLALDGIKAALSPP
ncbi:D-glycerate dehydrogenase [Acidocella sp.]|uniref:2-hydroxyacid dehydrogenase n=1 Tax=Acidocella sp. TaxID=50710 RepID=UPI0026366818|nr:D-glycerate dehydrogenase [Acidocella sp.]